MYKIHGMEPVILSNNADAIVDSMLIDTTSPKEAAKGVAKLSGFILHRYEIMMTTIITKSMEKEHELIISRKIKKEKLEYVGMR